VSSGFLLHTASHARDVALVGFLLTVAYGIGRRALDCLPPLVLRRGERLVFSEGLGMGILGTAFLAAAFAHVLRPTALVVILAVAAVVGYPSIRALPGELSVGVRRWWRRSPAGWRAAAVAVTALAGGALFLQALLPPTDWDALMYHLPVPQAFLEAGGLTVPTGNLHVAFAGLLHMLYVPLLAFGSASAPALLSAACALLLAAATTVLAERFLGNRTSVFSLLLLWSTTVILLVSATARVDVALAFLLVLSIHAALAACESERTAEWLILAGAIAGTAVAVKLTAALFAVALAPLIVWAAWRRSTGVARGSKLLLCFGAPLLLVAAPWLIKNAVLLGAPFYPVLGAHRAPPWLAGLYPGPVPLASVPRGAFRALAHARQPFNFVDLIFHPSRLTPEAEARHYVISPSFILIPGVVLLRRARAALWLLAVALLFGVLVVVPRSTTNLRYLLPAVPLLTIVAAAVADRLARSIPWRSVGEALLALGMLLALLPAARLQITRVHRRGALSYALGTTTGRGYLESAPEPGFVPLYRMSAFVNDHLGPESRTLMLFEARGWYFRRPVLQDDDLTNWPLLTPLLDTDPCLASSGITHVLVNVGALSYYEHRGLDPAVVGWPAFPRFERRCLRPVHEEPGLVLFERIGASDRTGGRTG